MPKRPEDAAIDKGRCLLQQGLNSEAILYFAQSLRNHPRSARIHLHSAFAHDRIGNEEQAIPLYERALALGLDKADARDAHVCLASSLRNIGKSRIGSDVLNEVKDRYPRDVVFDLFTALLATELDRPHDAIRTLVGAVLRESDAPDLERYRNVLRAKFNRLLDDIASHEPT